MTTSPHRSTTPLSVALPGPGVPARDRELRVIQNDAWRVGVLPGTGASVAFGQIADGEGWVDLLRPTPADKHWSVEDCASFVMLPWSNRVREGLLAFDGRGYRLRVNADDGTAIHGTARDFPWEVAVATPTAVVATFDSRDYSGVNYPWPFTASVTYQVADRRLSVVTELFNQHHEPVPAGLGHHPYFTKALAGPGDDALLEVPFDQTYELRRALPTGPPVDVRGRVDYRSLRPLGDEFVDDCFTGRHPGAPVRIRYPRSGRSVTLGSDDVFTHAVLYVPTDRPWFAVEPVTNANDGFTLLAQGTPGSGVVVVPPGEALRAAWWLDLDS